MEKQSNSFIRSVKFKFKMKESNNNLKNVPVPSSDRASAIGDIDINQPFTKHNLNCLPPFAPFP